MYYRYVGGPDFLKKWGGGRKKKERECRSF
jgi:hypothetical protein